MSNNQKPLVTTGGFLRALGQAALGNPQPLKEVIDDARTGIQKELAEADAKEKTGDAIDTTGEAKP